MLARENDLPKSWLTNLLEPSCDPCLPLPRVPDVYQMSVDRKADGAWRARWRDRDGNQRAKNFRLKADAVAFDTQMRADLMRGEFVLPSASKMTLADLADAWLEASVHLGPGSKYTYGRDLKRYILPNFGNRKIADIDRNLIQQLIVDELKILSPTSVHRHYRTLHTMFEWALRASILGINPCHGVNPPKMPPPKVNFLTAEQVERLADEISPRYRALVLVAAFGGMRWGELIGLRRGSVDGPRITVTEQLQMRDGVWMRETPKTLSGRRTVLLPASIGDELARHLDEFAQPGSDGLVFPNAHNEPTGHSFRSNVWQPACLKAGLATRGIGTRGKMTTLGAPKFHDLRHTAVALAISAGAHPKAIQQRLGHSSIGVTMNTYGHLLDAVGEEVAEGLDRLRSKG